MRQSILWMNMMCIPAIHKEPSVTHRPAAHQAPVSNQSHSLVVQLEWGQLFFIAPKVHNYLLTAFFSSLGALICCVIDMAGVIASISLGKSRRAVLPTTRYITKKKCIYHVKLPKYTYSAFENKILLWGLEDKKHYNGKKKTFREKWGLNEDPF